MNRRPWAHLIGSRDLNLGWPPLYALTFGLHFLTGFLRALVAAVVLLIVDLLTVWILGLHLPVNTLALVIGYGTLLLSLATLVLPLGGRWWQQAEGGRRPTEHEQATFEIAFAKLREADPGLRAPAHWFVVDSPEANAAAYADALAVDTALLDSPYLAAVLAHELGHLNSSDARVTAAVLRLIVGPRAPEEELIPFVGALLSGRLAMFLTAIPWEMWWLRRETTADAYAAGLGQGPELAEFLETHVVDRPTPFRSFGGSSHPWTAHRVEALEHLDD